MNETAPVLVLLTGGTIDAESYQVRPPTITPLKQSAIPGAIEKPGLRERCEFKEICRKDSKSVSDEDLRRALEAIRETSGLTHAVIVHGTDTMPVNARRFSRMIAAADTPSLARRVVIFTGSMVPLMNGPRSDGWENLRIAVAEGTHYPPGVHIVMHGLRLDPAYTVKEFGDSERLPRMVQQAEPVAD